MNIKYNEHQIKKWFTEFLKGDTIKEISFKFNVPVETIRYHLKKEKILENFSLDHHVFDIIDSDEKAYWLGYIMGDGCISMNRNSYVVNISSNDIEVLENFKKFLKSNRHKISKCNFKITSKNM